MSYRVGNLWVSVGFWSLMVGAAFGQAALPTASTYQGRLTNNGVPASGTYDFQFKLFDGSGGGAAQVGATVCKDGVSVVDGLFTVTIDFGANAFDGDARWLEISTRADATAGNCGAGAYTLLSPRQPVAATPYALTALTALTTVGVDGHSLDASDGSPVDVLFVDAGGQVGIGTTTPAYKLTVLGTNDTILKLESSNTAATRLQLSNTDQGTYAYDIGVTGSGASVGTDKLLIRDVTAGNVARLILDTAGNLGIGVNNPLDRLHVNGNIRVSDNSDIFGLDELVGAGNLRLSADATGGPDFMILSSGQCGVGTVYTNVTFNINEQIGDQIFNVELGDGTDVFEVQTDQEVFVLGDFFVQNGTKNFILDHPLDPANKSLVHNAVEGPGYFTFYRGNAVLEPDGAAWVELPDYFDALNAEPSYQLTCVGGYAPVYVAEEIRNHRFRIAGGRPGMKVSWQVTGLRNDPFARDNPYRDVREKTGLEQGRYYYPAGYGAPQEMSMARKPETAPAAATPKP